MYTSDTFEVLIEGPLNTAAMRSIVSRHVHGGYEVVTRKGPEAFFDPNGPHLWLIDLVPIAESDVDRVTADLRSWSNRATTVEGQLVWHRRIPGPREKRESAITHLVISEAFTRDRAAQTIDALIAAVREDLELNPVKRRY